MEWKDRYPKKVKPTFDELLEFMPIHIRELFLTFNREMESKYRVYNKYQRYSKDDGWVYGFCRNYRCELLCAFIRKDCFCVLGIAVNSEETLQSALNEVKKVYDAGYEKTYADLSAKRREDQIKRTKLRLEREKAQMDCITEKIDKTKLNQFKWCPKLSRNALLQLYLSDAKGIMDQELLDEVGYTFYTRCKQAQDAGSWLEKGRLLCHHCGTVLSPTGYTAVVACTCGYCYTYREYRRSFHTHNMPAGRATAIFDQYAQKWPGCIGYNEKMRLIDWLIHECHVSLMSGVQGRSVCVNLIEGTKKQISDLITELAFGK